MFVERAQRKSQNLSGIGSAHQQWKLGKRAFGLRFERVDPLPFRVSSLAHVGVIGFEEQKYSRLAKLFARRTAGSTKALQDNPGKSSAIQELARKHKTKKPNAGESKGMQERKKLSNLMQENPRKYSKEKIRREEKQEHTEGLATARWSFV